MIKRLSKYEQDADPVTRGSNCRTCATGTGLCEAHQAQRVRWSCRMQCVSCRMAFDRLDSMGRCATCGREP